eukprot:CAMPEP_0198249684 /NCGR_PEP_ID=MMETSP1447-20131203/1129_1 /TAXON_ID=420782 /ORGANISM="Chaetoceros dichaeta, Strain CCMP1751" /LENGTH=418 /DNA_ID=CAMNT_0043934371 /DNA_START=135 /DNA_END=1391 /DNA_ORIENTATION=-
MNVEGDALTALRKFFKIFGKKHPAKLIVKALVEEDDLVHRLKVRRKNSEIVLLEGGMQKRDDDDRDPNVGNYASFQAKTEAGMSTIEKIVDITALNGIHAVIPHKRVETELKEGYKLVSVTGFGPEYAKDNDEDNEDDEYVVDDGKQGLATRFTLFHKDEEVARCHMTYEDCTYDPSMGPTIEMIAVKQSRRGEGLGKILWYWVKIFIEDNFNLECLNNDISPGHVMVKATQLLTNEVETRQDKEGNSMIPVGFKSFMFDYCGFSVREQKGAASFMMGNSRPKDEEAVKYISLLSKEDMSSRTHESLVKKMPKIGKGYMRERNGKRVCMYCKRVGSDGTDLVCCAKCSIAFYCNAQCQKTDWKRHKKWCGKSREQVRKMMIDEGLIDEDGGITIRPTRGVEQFYGSVPEKLDVLSSLS